MNKTRFPINATGTGRRGLTTLSGLRLTELRLETVCFPLPYDCPISNLYPLKCRRNDVGDPYLSEIKYLGGANQDFIEIAVDAGTDVSDLNVTIYYSNGTIRSSNAVSELSSTTIAGRDVYVMDTTSSSTFNGVAWHNGVSLSDSSGVYDFVSFSDTAATVTASEGPASGLTSTEIGQAGRGDSLETTDRGDSYYTQTTPNSGSIPCLTKGTRVQTLFGPVAVEDLKDGTFIRTQNGGYKPLARVLSTKISAKRMNQTEALRPIKICAGALGMGLPKRDLWVSRQHRMLISSPIVKRMFGSRDVLVAAAKLVGLPGIFVDHSIERTTYYHLIFDTHEVIFAEGAPTESLLIAEQAMAALPCAVRKEIVRLFPNWQTQAVMPASACLIPDNKRQKRLVRRHFANSKSLLSVA